MSKPLFGIPINQNLLRALEEIKNKKLKINVLRRYYGLAPNRVVDIEKILINDNQYLPVLIVYRKVLNESDETIYLKMVQPGEKTGYQIIKINDNKLTFLENKIE